MVYSATCNCSKLPATQLPLMWIDPVMVAELLAQWSDHMAAEPITVPWEHLHAKLRCYNHNNCSVTIESPNLAFLCRNLDYKPYSINQ